MFYFTGDGTFGSSQNRFCGEEQRAFLNASATGNPLFLGTILLGNLYRKGVRGL